MISFRSWCGLFGNQLFQYCLGHILSKKTGRAVSFPKSFTFDFSGTQARIWTPHNGPGVIFQGDRNYSLNHDLDFRIFGEPWNVNLQGNFEVYDYYRDSGDLIRELLPLSVEAFDPTVLTIHIRQNVHKRPQRALHLDTLEKYVDHFSGITSRCVVTDSPNHPAIRAFCTRLGVSPINGNPTDDFLLLARSRNVLMTQGTFSWWATYLGHAEQVICPLWPGSLWSEYMEGIPNRPRLLVDEPRFSYPKTDFARQPDEPRPRFIDLYE